MGGGNLEQSHWVYRSNNPTLYKSVQLLFQHHLSSRSYRAKHALKFLLLVYWCGFTGKNKNNNFAISNYCNNSEFSPAVKLLIVVDVCWLDSNELFK
jgi:hypothetical protein